MDYGIFNMRTDVNECDCTRGCTDTLRESVLKVDSGRKIPCRTGESNLRRQLAGPMLYQLSYIPNQTCTWQRKVFEGYATFELRQGLPLISTHSPQWEKMRIRKMPQSIGEYVSSACVVNPVLCPLSREGCGACC